MSFISRIGSCMSTLKKPVKYGTFKMYQIVTI